MSDISVPPGWRIVKANGFMAHIGPLLCANADGVEKVFALQTTDVHSNHIGLVHGGVLTSLLDQAIAIVAWNAANRHPVVTIQMDTQFLAAAKAGEFLEARPRIRHAAGSLMFVEADLTCGSTTVAIASAIMKKFSTRGASQ